ncbi:hypothetical protein CL654_01885 [bacterium]|nr:hypothetical protein [bacterium]|tara:strand:+ start:12934 stop:14709 length:1776 start_codon:yes stop_codon:yes gene_type:complete
MIVNRPHFLILSFIVLLFGLLAIAFSAGDAFAQGGARNIEIKTPNGGETLIAGDTYRITWDASENIDKVNLDWSRGPGSLNTIVSSIDNTGYYDWTVNVGNTINTQFKIRVRGYDTGYGSVTDESDDFFTVVSANTAGSLPVTSRPFIHSIEPAQARVGQTVVVNGARFNNDSFISIYDASGSGPVALPTNITDTTLTFTVPSSLSSGSYWLKVTHRGNSNYDSTPINFTILTTPSVPNINSTSPISAKGGEVMTLYGNNFGQGSYVEVLGLVGSSSLTAQQTIGASSLTSTSLSFIVPTNLTAGTYWIQIGEKASETKSNRVYMMIASDVGGVRVIPNITSVSPSQVGPGDTVTIYGSNFTPGGMYVEVVGMDNLYDARSTSNSVTWTVPQWGFGPGLYSLRVVDRQRLVAGEEEKSVTSNAISLSVTSSTNGTITPVTPTPIVTTPATGTAFTRNLWRGMNNDDVRRLQEFLARDAELYPEGITSGYYGKLTEAAVQNFQCKYNIICGGTSDSTGYGLVGPQTIAKLNEVYGNGGNTSTGTSGNTSSQTTAPSSSGSSGLSQSQVDAIVNLLQALGADATIIANVRSVL